MFIDFVRLRHIQTCADKLKKKLEEQKLKLGNLNPDDPGFKRSCRNHLVDKITELQKKIKILMTKQKAVSCVLV
jgi:hypothetical protein